MPPKKRRPRPCGDRGTSDLVLAGRFDFLSDNPQNPEKQEQPHRNAFARDAVFAAFGRHGRALDHRDFVDRQPAPASVWWRT